MCVYAYHLLNRAVERRLVFRIDGDWVGKRRSDVATERRRGRNAEVPRGGAEGGVRSLAYGVMGNHWHLVVHRTADGALSPFVKWLTLTHTRRYCVGHRSVGSGPLYQGRFKSS